MSLSMSVVLWLTQIHLTGELIIKSMGVTVMILKDKLMYLVADPVYVPKVDYPENTSDNPERCDSRC